MKRLSRLFFALVFSALITVSWALALGAKPAAAKQAELIARAEEYIEDGIYISAAPLLEEAAGYSAAYTSIAETRLKTVYTRLIAQSGYRRKYTELLNKQMGRKNARPEVFYEAAIFYLKESKLNEALAALKSGIEKTAKPELVELYERHRYGYKMGYDIYDGAAEISGGAAGVSLGGLWGFASPDGTPLIECGYEKVSAFCGGRAVVKKNGVIFAVDMAGNRVALLKDAGAIDFGHYSEGRAAILFSEGWRRASGGFELGSAVFEQIGAYSDGFAAAKQGGRWGLVDKSSNWLIPASYDEIIMDGLGRAYAQGAAFVREDGAVYMMSGGMRLGGPYEDARPFGAEGYAAVKENGLWGFIDSSGELVIDYSFEDASSFGRHLAAVQCGGLWGYINLYGKIVIEPEFLLAKSFEDGSAPVLTGRGWRFITLIEYLKKAGL